MRWQEGAEDHDLWWRGLDLNQRPSGYEPDELPDCSTPRRPPHDITSAAATVLGEAGGRPRRSRVVRRYGRVDGGNSDTRGARLLAQLPRPALPALPGRREAPAHWALPPGLAGRTQDLAVRFSSGLDLSAAPEAGGVERRVPLVCGGSSYGSARRGSRASGCRRIRSTRSPSGWPGRWTSGRPRRWCRPCSSRRRASPRARPARLGPAQRRGRKSWWTLITPSCASRRTLRACDGVHGMALGVRRAPGWPEAGFDDLRCRAVALRWWHLRPHQPLPGRPGDGLLRRTGSYRAASPGGVSAASDQTALLGASFDAPECPRLAHKPGSRHPARGFWRVPRAAVSARRPPAAAAARPGRAHGQSGRVSEDRARPYLSEAQLKEAVSVLGEVLDKLDES